MNTTLDLQKDSLLGQRPRLKEACLKLQQMALELGPDAKLPTMIELRAQLGVSFSTLNNAVRELERHGMLRSINGVGVYVASPPNNPVTGRLGLYLHIFHLTDPYTVDLLNGVRREAARRGLEVVLLNEEDSAIEPGKVDAVLMYCHVTEALLLNLPLDLPHVLLFQHSPEFTCIVADDFEGAKMATHHLFELGHRRIAYLLHSNYDSISRQRLAGYEAAHKEWGFVIDEKRVKFLHKTAHQNYREVCEAVMMAWLEEDWRDLNCTAMLAHNDQAAIGVIKVLADAGLRVPQDASVVGFDGTETSELCTPSLTTIKVPLNEIGARAVKVLWEQICEGVSQPEKIVLPVQLKRGGSVAPITKA